MSSRVERFSRRSSDPHSRISFSPFQIPSQRDELASQPTTTQPHPGRVLEAQAHFPSSLGQHQQARQGRFKLFTRLPCRPQVQICRRLETPPITSRHQASSLESKPPPFVESQVEAAQARQVQQTEARVRPYSAWIYCLSRFGCRQACKDPIFGILRRTCTCRKARHMPMLTTVPWRE